MKQNVRKSDPVDAALGQQIGALRRALRMTQRQLAAAIGVSYQQLQKYESGLTHMSAGRLQELAVVLHVPVWQLFDAADDQAAALRPQDIDVVNFLSTDEGQELNIAFNQIADRNVRRKMMALVKTIAESA